MLAQLRSQSLGNSRLTAAKPEGGGNPKPEGAVKIPGVACDIPHSAAGGPPGPRAPYRVRAPARQRPRADASHNSALARRRPTQPHHGTALRPSSPEWTNTGFWSQCWWRIPLRGGVGGLGHGATGFGWIVRLRFSLAFGGPSGWSCRSLRAGPDDITACVRDP